MIQYHSATGVAAWTDLTRLLLDAAASPILGSLKVRHAGQRKYLYDRYRIGGRVRDRYLGEDTPALRARLAKSAAGDLDRKALERECARLVRILAAETYLTTDAGTGRVLAGMAKSGVFRLGGTLVGTQAFRTYEGLLGVRLGLDRAAVTNDIDIAAFERLSVTLGDRVDSDLPTLLNDLGMEPLPALDPARTWRWRDRKRQTLLEFLTPSFAEAEDVRPLPAFGVSAQALHHLNYLIAEPVAVPLLYRSGILVQVPRPERYAIHKFIVADRRREGANALKARKDRAQATFLIDVLSEDRPEDLADAYADALARGPVWRSCIQASLDRLPEQRAKLDALMGRA